MNMYNTASLHRGAGALEHVLRQDCADPTASMTVERAIGFIATAIDRGLFASFICHLIDTSFDDQTARFMFSIFEMYKGYHQTLHLWHDTEVEDRMELTSKAKALIAI